MSEIRLKVYRSPTEFRTETYRQGRVSAGRDVNNDICLPEKDVSRFHCMFQCDDEGWMIVDLESTNGTFLNGICIKKGRLKSGDVVVVGNTRVHVMECPSASEAAPATAGNYRLVQTFDARVLAGAKGFRPVRREAVAKPAGRGEPTPMPSVPKTLAPILTAEEILQGAREPQATARAIATWLYPLIDANACLVYLCDPETQVLEPAAVEPPKKIVLIPREILDYVSEHRIAIHAQVDKGGGGLGGPVQAVMCAPILDRQRLLGVMALIRTEAPWKLGDPDLEAVAVAALAAGSALGCAREYADLERAYLGLLEAQSSLPASIGDTLQDEAESVVVESTLQRLRAALARGLEAPSAAAENAPPDDASGDRLDRVLEAVRESEHISEQLVRLCRQRREAAGEAWPAELLTDLVPVLRQIGGPSMQMYDRVASELPVVAVAPRVVRAALARVVMFCRDRMKALRLTLTAELHGFEEPLEVVGSDEVAPGHYVHVAIEAEGDATAIDDLHVLFDDDAEPPRDLRESAAGLYWAARMLRRAAGRLIVRPEGDRGVGFDLYLPVLT